MKIEYILVYLLELSLVAWNVCRCNIYLPMLIYTVSHFFQLFLYPSCRVDTRSGSYEFLWVICWKLLYFFKACVSVYYFIRSLKIHLNFLAIPNHDAQKKLIYKYLYTYSEKHVQISRLREIPAWMESHLLFPLLKYSLNKFMLCNTLLIVWLAQF